jgi:CDP-glucose 4,6-dehydratase
VERYGQGSITTDIIENKHHEAQLLQLNCDKAHQCLGWYPRWDVKRTLNMTSDWYKKVLNGATASDVTREQLFEYFPELL